MFCHIIHKVFNRQIWECVLSYPQSIWQDNPYPHMYRVFYRTTWECVWSYPQGVSQAYLGMCLIIPTRCFSGQLRNAFYHTHTVLFRPTSECILSYPHGAFQANFGMYCNRRASQRFPVHADVTRCGGFCVPKNDVRNFFSIQVNATSYFSDNIQGKFIIIIVYI